MSHATGMWGGRFEGDADAVFRALNDSLPIDWRLVSQDIRGSMAWASGLVRAGVLSAEDGRAVRAALGDLLQHAQALRDPPIESGAEDVHTWVEQELTARIGELGKKLHTGRSRNDQVATDLRLWLMDVLEERVGQCRALQRALCRLSRRAGSTPIPSYTHLQKAQPVLFAHWCLAYVEMLERDVERLRQTRARTSVCPLGSAALAGTTFQVDRGALAVELGFDAVSGNSLDAVSDRDFVLDAISSAAVCGLHLSRLAEDLIIYASTEFGFVALGDAVTSGSSLMPQKKNPDSLELLRGKAGRLAGGFVTMAMTIKGLPLAYNKDLQEDKEALFDAMDQLGLVLSLAAMTIDETDAVTDRCRGSASTGYLNATEAADHLVARGVPFRTAHEQVGGLVRAAIKAGVELEDLPIDLVHEIAPAAGESWKQDLGLERSLSRRDVLGGTAPQQVAGAISGWEQRLGLADQPPPRGDG